MLWLRTATPPRSFTDGGCKRPLPASPFPASAAGGPASTARCPPKRCPGKPGPLADEFPSLLRRTNIANGAASIPGDLLLPVGSPSVSMAYPSGGAANLLRLEAGRTAIVSAALRAGELQGESQEATPVSLWPSLSRGLRASRGSHGHQHPSCANLGGADDGRAGGSAPGGPASRTTPTRLGRFDDPDVVGMPPLQRGHRRAQAGVLSIPDDNCRVGMLDQPIIASPDRHPGLLLGGRLLR